MNKLRWGILATGRIAGVFAQGVRDSTSGVLAAVASRDRVKATLFAETHEIPRAHGSYEALLADPEVDAIYIATPHPLHVEWTIQAARHGKHILCEKPAALHHADAMAMVEAAHRHNVFFMEAFMYRCHPQTRKLAELVAEKRVGETRMIRATFGFDVEPNPTSRLFSQDLGGGGILDVGCYPASMVRLLAGAAIGQPFAEPVELSGSAQLGPESGVDEWAVASAKFASGIVAQLSTSIRVRQENVVQVFGSDGYILIPNPWMPGRTGEPGKILVFAKNGGPPEEISIPADHSLYALEADAFAEGVRTGEAPRPAMSPADTLGNMRFLDRWRAAVGLVYPVEKKMGPTPWSGKPLRWRETPPLPYGRLPGIDQPISRLVFGVDNQTGLQHGRVMFDDFVERGGNCFDTAHIYRRGECEAILGTWLEARGIREEIVLIAKGAHTPNCFPAAVSRELTISLERLKTEYADLYLLHRDSPDIPAGEFVDALEAEVARGRVRAYGASNWSLARVEEANAYARKKGLRGFCCVSNQFSLANLINPPWAGCVSASDEASKEWLRANSFPLFGWASQAQGFFAGLARRDWFANPMMERCWKSEENFARLDRVRELAAERGVAPTAIALAYVLHQSFPTFALIGCRSLAEMRTSWEALSIKLSEQDVAWLEKGS